MNDDVCAQAQSLYACAGGMHKIYHGPHDMKASLHAFLHKQFRWQTLKNSRSQERLPLKVGGSGQRKKPFFFLCPLPPIKSVRDSKSFARRIRYFVLSSAGGMLSCAEHKYRSSSTAGVWSPYFFRSKRKTFEDTEVNSSRQ